MVTFTLTTLTSLVCVFILPFAQLSQATQPYIDQQVYQDLNSGSRSILFMATILPSSQSNPEKAKQRLLLIVDKPDSKSSLFFDLSPPDYVYYDLPDSHLIQQPGERSFRVLLHGGRLLSVSFPELYKKLHTQTTTSRSKPYLARFFLLSTKDSSKMLLLYSGNPRQSVFAFNLETHTQMNANTPFMLNFSNLSVISTPTETDTIYANIQSLGDHSRHVLFQKESVQLGDPLSFSANQPFYGCAIEETLIVSKRHPSSCDTNDAQGVSFTSGFITQERVYLLTPTAEVLSFPKIALQTTDSDTSYDLERIPLGDFFLLDARSRRPTKTSTFDHSLFVFLIIFLPVATVWLLLCCYCLSRKSFWAPAGSLEPIQAGSLLRTSNTVVSKLVKEKLSAKTAKEEDFVLEKRAETFKESRLVRRTSQGLARSSLPGGLKKASGRGVNRGQGTPSSAHLTILGGRNQSMAKNSKRRKTSRLTPKSPGVSVVRKPSTSRRSHKKKLQTPRGSHRRRSIRKN